MQSTLSITNPKYSIIEPDFKRFGTPDSVRERLIRKLSHVEIGELSYLISSHQSFNKKLNAALISKDNRMRGATEDL